MATSKDKGPFIATLWQLAGREKALRKFLGDMRNLMVSLCDRWNKDLPGGDFLRVTEAIYADGSLECSWSIQIGAQAKVNALFTTGPGVHGDKAILGRCHLFTDSPDRPVDTFDLVAKDEGVEWEGDPSKWINVVEERLLRVVAAQAEVALRRLRPGQQE